MQKAGIPQIETDHTKFPDSLSQNKIIKQIISPNQSPSSGTISIVRIVLKATETSSSHLWCIGVKNQFHLATFLPLRHELFPIPLVVRPCVSLNAFRGTKANKHQSKGLGDSDRMVTDGAVDIISVSRAIV